MIPPFFIKCKGFLAITQMKRLANDAKYASGETLYGDIIDILFKLAEVLAKFYILWRNLKDIAQFL